MVEPLKMLASSPIVHWWSGVQFWWPNFPVLVYFKVRKCEPSLALLLLQLAGMPANFRVLNVVQETQTKPEGQIHFFPVIFNGKQVYDVMVERCGTSQNSAP